MQRKMLVLALVLCLAASMLASIKFIPLTQANAILPPEKLPTNNPHLFLHGTVRTYQLLTTASLIVDRCFLAHARDAASCGMS